MRWTIHTPFAAACLTYWRPCSGSSPVSPSPHTNTLTCLVTSVTFQNCCWSDAQEPRLGDRGEALLLQLRRCAWRQPPTQCALLRQMNMRQRIEGAFAPRGTVANLGRPCRPPCWLSRYHGLCSVRIGVSGAHASGVSGRDPHSKQPLASRGVQASNSIANDSRFDRPIVGCRIGPRVLGRPKLYAGSRNSCVYERCRAAS